MTERKRSPEALERRMAKLTDAEWARAARAYNPEEGITTKHLARRFGINEDTMAAGLKRAGITLRPSGRSGSASW